MDVVIGLAVVAAVVLAGYAFSRWDRRNPERTRRAGGVDRLPTTGPDSGGQRQGGHVNPYTPPIRQDGINNSGGF